jgi:hypothetical protein
MGFWRNIPDPTIVAGKKKKKKKKTLLFKTLALGTRGSCM